MTVDQNELKKTNIADYSAPETFQFTCTSFIKNQIFGKQYNQFL